MARLVIDDDVALQRALKVALQLAGHEVSSAITGERGIAETAAISPDVVVLDLGLTDIDGTVVCHRIREWSTVPIIVLSAADAETRKVAALDEGADDYVTKPFGMAELEARIRAALRRVHGNDDTSSDLTVGSLHIDLVHHQAEVDGAMLKLTARKFDVLVFLARHTDKICTNQMILQSVWGLSYAKENGYLHAYVHRLRKKLEGAPEITIENSSGTGYVLHQHSADTR